MKKIIISAIFISILICFIIFLQNRKTKIKEKTELVAVKTCRAEFENVYSDIESSGTVFYKTKTDITALVPGNIILRNVQEGDYVTKGQILYKLKNIELEIEHTQNQNRLNSSKANLELNEAKLEEKEKEIKAKLILINNLKSEIEISEKSLALSKEKLDKSMELNKLGGITDQEIKEMQNQIFAMTTQLDIQKRELQMNNLGYTKSDLIQNGITPSNDKEILNRQFIELNSKTSRADVEVAKAEYKNACANLLLTEKLLDDLIVKSPVNGIIGALNHENGEYVTQNENLATIIDISTCVATIKIQEQNIYDISVGNRTKIEIPAANTTIDSFISEISPVADNETGNFFVKADFKNKENNIKPGMYLKCTISNNCHTKYLKIPETALINTTEKTADCFIVKNNIALIQKLKIAFIKNGFAFIDSGITDEYQIINNPPKTIKDGTNVKIL